MGMRQPANSNSCLPAAVNGGAVAWKEEGWEQLVSAEGETAEREVAEQQAAAAQQQAGGRCLPCGGAPAGICAPTA